MAQEFWRPARMAGAALLAVIVVFAVIGPLLTAADPNRQDLSNVLAPASLHDLLGTDHLGRSMLARLTHATRLSLALALTTVVSAAILGILLGLVAAIGGGLIDRTLSLAADGIMAIPGVLLVLLFSSLAPGNFLMIYLGITSYGWVEYFRIARAIASTELRRPYIEAAILNGFSWRYVAARLLLPKLAPVVLTLMAFGVGTAIFTISALSVIGIGLRPPVAEWGTMTIDLLPYFDEAPLQALAPTAMVATTVLGLHLLFSRSGT